MSRLLSAPSHSTTPSVPPAMQSRNARRDNSAPPDADDPPAAPALPAPRSDGRASTQPASPTPRPAANRAATAHNPHTEPQAQAGATAGLARTLHTAPPPPGSKPRSTSRPTRCGASPPPRCALVRKAEADAPGTADPAPDQTDAVSGHAAAPAPR